MKINFFRLLLWVISIAIVALLFFFENETASLYLLFVITVLPLLSIIAVSVLHKSIYAEIILTQDGRDVTLTYETKGTAAILTGKIIFTGEIINLLSDEYVEITESKTTMKDIPCGRISANIYSVVVSDIFGIIKLNSKFNISDDIIIEPETYPIDVLLSSDTILTSESERYSSTKAGSDPSETFDIREYIPGDNLKLIHSKLSSKTDKLMVRELGQPINDSILILYDRSVQNTQTYDEVTFLYSLSKTLKEMGISHNIGLVYKSFAEIFDIQEYDGDISEISFILLEADMEMSCEEAFANTYTGCSFSTVLSISCGGKEAPLNISPNIRRIDFSSGISKIQDIII